jgi:hypothetical protein
MTNKCFDICIKSFQEKPLSPFDKECMHTCLQNLNAFYLEVKNSFNLPAWSRFLEYLFLVGNKSNDIKFCTLVYIL